MPHPAEIFAGRIVAFFDDDDEIVGDQRLEPIQRAALPLQRVTVPPIWC